MMRALLLVATLAGCAGLRQPTGGDVARVQAVWPDATLEELTLGRTTYVRRCAGCHQLFLPETRSAERWARSLDEMGEKAKLTPEERRVIERFLVALAAP
jgi:hypothetical protein